MALRGFCHKFQSAYVLLTLPKSCLVVDHRVHKHQEKDCFLLFRHSSGPHSDDFVMGGCIGKIPRCGVYVL